MRMTTVALVLTVSSLAACGDDSIRRDFTVVYKVQGYDHGRATQQLDKCLALPGAKRGFVNLSDPPQPNVSVEGSPDEADALELCLRRLPNAVVKQSG